jgi:DMSO/TMAO reductase YedYZ molybdopterin-dependent catalytic subunit
VLPQVSPGNWTLAIDGMVDHPLEISFDELLKMPLTEAEITLVCVSNRVGGTYNGNARWLGAPLAGLLRRAGVQAGADQVLFTSTDGMTISTPVATIMDCGPSAGRLDRRLIFAGNWSCHHRSRRSR